MADFIRTSAPRQETPAEEPGSVSRQENYNGNLTPMMLALFDNSLYRSRRAGDPQAQRSYNEDPSAGLQTRLANGDPYAKKYIHSENYGNPTVRLEKGSPENERPLPAAKRFRILRFFTGRN